MITGVNHVTLVVADLARSLAFWKDTLGLTLRAQSPKLAYLEGGSLWLCPGLESEPLGRRVALYPRP